MNGQWTKAANGHTFHRSATHGNHGYFLQVEWREWGWESWLNGELLGVYKHMLTAVRVAEEKYLDKSTGMG